MCLPGLVVSDDSSDGSDGSGGSDDTSEGQRWRIGIQCAAEAPSLFILTVRCAPLVFERVYALSSYFPPSSSIHGVYHYGSGRFHEYWYMVFTTVSNRSKWSHFRM